MKNKSYIYMCDAKNQIMKYLFIKIFYRSVLYSKAKVGFYTRKTF